MSDFIPTKVLDAIEADAKHAVGDDTFAADVLRLVRNVRALSGDHPIGDVLSERARQEAKWGEQNHDPFVYGAILGEEVGEFMQAALKARFESDDARISIGYMQDMRAEAVQAAAVALAIVECLDRGKWTWGGQALPAVSP